jgi:prevent-host-death family protein
MELTLQDIIPISQARARLTELADDVASHGGVKLLTRNGEGYAAIVPAQDVDDLQQFRAAKRLSDLQTLAQAMTEIEDGTTVPFADFAVGMMAMVADVKAGRKPALSTASSAQQRKAA